MTDYTPIFADSERSPEAEVYPFAIPDLWAASRLAPDLSRESQLFPIALLQADTKHIASSPSPTPQTSLFAFNLGFLRTPEPSHLTSQVASGDSQSQSSTEEYNADASSATSVDIWAQPDAVREPEKPRFRSWDSFLVEDAEHPRNPYFSEAGPSVFDAALEEYMEGDVGGVVRTDVFCTCLLHLGLGRSSVLFEWDDVLKEFRAVRPNLRISGCTSGTVESIVSSFASTGKKIHFLTSYTSTIYSTRLNPSTIALADCITSILESIQTRLSIPSSAIRSLLHLHSLIREPALIINTFHSIITKAAGAKNDSVLLTRLFDVIQQEQHRNGWLKPLLMETLARVSRPWLGFIEEWIGLDRPIGGEGIGFEGLVERGLFVRVEEEKEVDERGQEVTRRNFVFDKKKVPSFTTIETAESIFETGKSLRFLQTFHPNHPLSKPGAVAGVRAPKLEWKFSWEDLENLQAQAKTYERQLRTAIADYTAGGSSAALPIGVLRNYKPETFEAFPTFGKSKDQIIDMISHSAADMNNAPPPLETQNTDILRSLVLSISRDLSSSSSSSSTTSQPDHLTLFAPPLSITPVLSFTHLLTAQASLINTSCLRLFFRQHNLITHLKLLRRFPLFGDGVFTSRLSNALFSDVLDTTEKLPGEHRSGGTMGLKLGSRDTWPPGSSELRLALMGILTDSFATPGGGSSTSGIYTAGKENILPGGLAFAVRDMTQEELEACLDPHGISALDFLKLQYTPPSPLREIITPTSLYRYDRLFRLLLRLQRMLFVTSKLRRDATNRTTRWRPEDQSSTATKFRIEAHHFVTTVAAYMLETGVAAPWAAFEKRLEEIGRALEEGEGTGEGVERIRALHEGVLDRIMFATLTRRRQAPAMALVEEVWVCVLKFARQSHGKAEGSTKDSSTSINEAQEEEYIKDLYKTFRRKISIFLSVIRGLSEKRGYGDGAVGKGAKGEEVNVLGVLVVRLEMNGYYADVK